MANSYRVQEFERIGGGRSEVYTSERGETLAYYDYHTNGYGSVTVFDPYKGTSGREYAARPVMRCRGIIYRHLDKLGFTILID